MTTWPRLIWPSDILIPGHGGPHKLHQTQIVNPSVSGVSQVSASSSGRWGLMLGGVPVVTSAQWLAFDAMDAELQGRLNQCLVRFCHEGRAPDGVALVGGVRFSDGASFSDGAGFAQSGHLVQAVLAAAAGATALKFEVLVGAAPVPGMKFTIGVRLHEIVRITKIFAGAIEAVIWPALREAVPAGTVLDFGTLHLLGRLASDSEMRLDDARYRRFGTRDIRFIEDTGPVL